jgi:hypothetical protein
MENLRKDTYKNRGRISWPEFNFAKEYFTGLPSHFFVKADLMKI